MTDAYDCGVDRPPDYLIAFTYPETGGSYRAPVEDQLQGWRCYGCGGFVVEPADHAAFHATVDRPNSDVAPTEDSAGA